MATEMIDAHGLIELASDAAFSVDGGLEIVAWNQEAQQLLGYTSDEVIGRHCSEIIQAVLDGGQPLCVPSCDGVRCFRRDQPFAVSDCCARHKDGGWVPISLASIVMPKRDRHLHHGAIVAVILLRSVEGEHNRSSPGQILQVSTFGRFALATGGRGLAVEKWERKQALTLMKFLVTHLGHAIHREVLIEHLWPEADESHGRERLKVTVYFLRQQLRAAGIEEDVVETVGKAYSLRPEAIWLDTEIFERLIANGGALQRQQRWDEALRCYEEAQRLYRGDFMEEDIYVDWCAEQRERLHEINLEMLAGMAECYAERACYAEAVRVCRTALVRDPYRESFHRALMTHLLRLGHTDSAVAQYHHCERLLARELGVEPMPETQRLYQRILERGAEPAAGEFPVAAPVSASHPAPRDSVALIAKGAE